MNRAFVLTFDRLHLGYLGCYGNEWIETPNFDQLALDSVVFDRHYGENFDVRAANHAWWTGRYQHPLDEDAQCELPCFAEWLHEAGIRSRLWLESDGGIEFGVAPRFDDVQSAYGADGLETPETDTPFARLISKCVDVLSDEHEGAPELVWLKSRGVPVPWLPPQEMADLYLDEFGLGDEPADDEFSESDVDDDILDHESDEPAEPAPRTKIPPLPEDVLYARALYAAYATHLDRWLGKLHRFLKSSPVWRDALFIVTAAGGENLAEHGPLGEENRKLRDEVTHAPLWVSLPGSAESGSRRSSLVQTVDLAPTLCEWFGIAGHTTAATETSCGKSLLPVVRGDADALRDTAWLGNCGFEQGIRTAEFLLVTSSALETKRSGDSRGAEPLLFEKPYDRWDMSDVRGQYLGEADALEQRLREWHSNTHK